MLFHYLQACPVEATRKFYSNTSFKFTYEVGNQCLKYIQGNSLYFQIIESLFERALNISHDRGRTSIAFPLIGAGSIGYPALDVIKTIMNACSFFVKKDSPLKEVKIVIHVNDSSTLKVSLSETF